MTASLPTLLAPPALQREYDRACDATEQASLDLARQHTRKVRVRLAESRLSTLDAARDTLNRAADTVDLAPVGEASYTAHVALGAAQVAYVRALAVPLMTGEDRCDVACIGAGQYLARVAHDARLAVVAAQQQASGQFKAHLEQGGLRPGRAFTAAQSGAAARHRIGFQYGSTPDSRGRPVDVARRFGQTSTPAPDSRVLPRPGCPLASSIERDASLLVALALATPPRRRTRRGKRGGKASPRAKG